MISAIYPHFLDNYNYPKYLSERVILTPTNHTVSTLNDLIVENISGETTSYFSVEKGNKIDLYYKGCCIF